MSMYERIDEMLAVQNMSRRQLAINAKIPPSTFQSAMERQKNITVEMVERIADTLGCSVEWLRTGETPEERSQRIYSETVEEHARMKEYFKNKNIEEFSALPGDVQRQLMALVRAIREMKDHPDE